MLVFIFLIFSHIFLLGLFIKVIYSYTSPSPPLDKKKKECGISVIIVAKDEYNYLQQLIPILFQQNYSNYEVIVVNDNSKDATAQLLYGFEKMYPNLVTITLKGIPKDIHSKKYGIQKAITQARNDILLLTDADCLPVSFDWLASINAHYDKKTDIVLGYSPYVKKGNFFLSYFVQYETIWVAINYFSMALLGMPYMAVGRNVSYRKSFFLKKKGFSTFSHSIGGDDDIFINRYALKKNTTIALEKESHTITYPSLHFSQWVQQKKRHILASRYYLLWKKCIIALWNIQIGVIYIFLFFAYEYLYFYLALFLLRWVVLGVVVYVFQKKTQTKQIFMITLPFMDMLYTLYILFQGIILFFVSKKIFWK